MTLTKKSIAKSVRLTQEVFDYIDSAPGNGFNEKFENIILEAKRGESDRISRSKSNVESRHYYLNNLQILIVFLILLGMHKSFCEI